ncbi:MAG TPA: penicillin-binding protein 2 [Gaiella sp.]|uniref:peptidoglycan D,D-transpeptidase FtsI family protein n=1 Tax=Gaiella sp. TaxID=2663207 RepID=UPI002D7F95B2|nr:penicillin-binding protein 2 [Gaiella sp.]HET9288327.1 penicillin-binding protein 2 [Gaiella sp.]
MTSGTQRANSRIRLLVVAFTCVFAVGLGRAAWIQIVDGAGYEAMASRQHRETIEIPAGRGTIYDRTGEPLAIGEQATSVYADPRNVIAPKKAAVKVAQQLGLDPDELYPTLVDRTRRFVFIDRKADPVKARALQKLGVAGIGFFPEERRTYPQGRVASQLLGFAGTDNRGLDGLERSLDRTLAGKAGYEIVVRDPAGQAIDVVTSRRERPGRNVVLTLDHQLQANAEQILASAVSRWGAKGATAVVMNPRTGAILAMANAPTFDANRFSSAPAEERRNRAVTDVYEPGSTFKIVTVAAALEDNVVTPDTAFTLAPTIKVADRVIREAHVRGTERMTVRQILSESSNVGTITIAKERLGGPELASWIDRFGFGKKTGSELPGESAGMVVPYQDWSGSTIGTVPIGQGIAVTPLQMVGAYAAIGNGGVMPPAHVVAKVGGKKVRHGKGRRIVSRHTADRMTAMFRDVVVEGTGTEAAIPGYTVAGKTGTANKAEGGRYVQKYVASFVGLVPARNPRLAILVMVDEPRGQIWGGVVAAPIFRDIARFALQYLEVPPDAPESKRASSLLAAAALTP